MAILWMTDDYTKMRESETECLRLEVHRLRDEITQLKLKGLNHGGLCATKNSELVQTVNPMAKNHSPIAPR